MKPDICHLRVRSCDEGCLLQGTEREKFIAQNSCCYNGMRDQSFVRLQSFKLILNVLHALRFRASNPARREKWEDEGKG
jgi:hypothetical protein